MEEGAEAVVAMSHGDGNLVPLCDSSCALGA